MPIGFDAASATEMSKQLTGLAIDPASFNNKADADVIRDLHAALTGSSEVMKKYGVIVNETAVKQELLNQGIDKNKATEQQKVMARMAIIMRGTTAAQGDAIRSAGSFANQMKSLKAKVSDAAVEIGSALPPIVTPLVTKIAAGVKIVAAWLREHKGLVVIIAKVAAALAAGGLAFIVLGTAVSGMASTFGAAAAVISGVGTAIEEAAGKREEAESGDEGPERLKKPGNLLKDLQQQLGGLDDRLQTTQDKISVTGTFNAAGVRGLGGGNPAQRTAKATEETAKNTKRILQEAQHGGLTFS